MEEREPQQTEEHESEPEPGEEIDFGAFVVSLATAALMQLGEGGEHGEGGEPELDLQLAKQTIDIIGMLRDKTRGNLTGAESQIIESALYDLRLKYVKARKRGAG